MASPPKVSSMPTAPLVASGLVGGYLVARETKVRPLGGAVLGAFGVAAGAVWLQRVGPAKTALLSAIYLGGFGASHPLAKKIGPWPSVLSVAGVSAAASYLIADRARP
ncbi:MAG: hypothetical protein R2726_21410 [Acidimicrobiales bacterium]